MFKKPSSLHNEQSFRGQNFADPLCCFHSSNIANACNATFITSADQRDHTWWNVCQHARQISLARIAGAGIEVAVVKDATASPKHPEWGYGYTAALINYAFLAHAVLTTEQAVKAIEGGQ